MSLNGALQVGRTAMVAAQAAMQVAGSNMANAATEGYHRRRVFLSAGPDEMVLRGAFIGTGVRLEAIKREVDIALQSRFRDATSQERADLIDQRFLTALETLQNELTDADLSTALSEFFNAFSGLANNPEDAAIRSVVIEQGVALSGVIGGLRNDYNSVLAEVDRALATIVIEANNLIENIAELNIKIAQTEHGVSEAGALRDHRDLLIDQLSEFLEVDIIPQESGAVDVLVNSTPVVIAGLARGIELRTQTVGTQLEITIRVAADGTQLSISEGQIGGLLRQREDIVQPAIDDLNTFAAELLFQVNRVHSQGQGQRGFETATGHYGVNDLTTNLNSPTTGLDFARIDNGSFFIHVTNQSTGIRTAHQINVDGNADSLNDLINEINVVVGVPNVTAAVGPDNVLTLTAVNGFEMTFSDDTSGALAALGINTFFTGASASDIDVNTVVRNDPTLLAAGQGHVPGSNKTALAISELQNTSTSDLGNRSLREFWQNTVIALAVKTSASNRSVDSSRLVRESLGAQIQAVSGVSIDEESINLLMFQRQFQAAARFIAVIDETLQTLLSIA